MRHPVAVLVPTLSLLLLLGVPFLHVRFNAPDSTILPPSVPVARGLRHPRPRVRGGRVRAARARDPHDRRRHDAGQRREAVRLLAGASRPTRGSAAWSSLVDVDPRLTLAQYQLLYAVARRAAGPVRRDGPRRDDEGRPHGVHRLHAATAPTATRRGRWSASCATRPARSRRPPGSRCWSAAAPRTSTTSCPACGRTSRGRRCSSSSRPSSCCSPSSGRWCCRSRRW